ncbi:MAG: NAD(P)-binding domain-containing protein [Alkalispirochaeta sp.]
MSGEHPTVGVFGVGRVGSALARLAVGAGYHPLLAGTADFQELQWMLDILSPGARACDPEELVKRSDFVVLSVPFGKAPSLPYHLFDGVIVVEAMNYWAPVDGEIRAVDGDGRSTSEIIADNNPRARWVKSLNHLGYHDMEDDPLPPGSADRRAVGVATDDGEAGATVAAFVDRIGFDPVLVGPLSAGRVLEPGGGVFGRRLTWEEFRAMVPG